MTQVVLDLIQAINSGDSIAIDSAFNAEMASRVSARLEDMRQDVAQNMFAEARKTKEKMPEEFTLEDYTLEEIQDFMMPEDFEQLDEISKKTLGSYVKTASNKGIN